jgi:predicted transcriptional regulator
MARSSSSSVISRPGKSARASAKAGATPTRVQTTLRLEPELRSGLETLQAALGTPLNKLVNMAVADFVAAKAAHLETELEAALEKIKTLRHADPTFSKDFKAIAAAELRHGKRDPVQGRAFREKPASAVSLVRRVVAAAK